MPSVTRRSSDARERREQVEAAVFAAVRSLLAGGERYTAIGVARIAEEAGIARSTFYVNFDDKADVLLRLARRTLLKLDPITERWVTAEAPDRAALREMFAAILAVGRADAPTFKALAELAAYDEHAARVWEDEVASFADVVAVRLDEERRAGRLRAGVDAVAIAHVIAWAVERSILQQVSGRSPVDDDRLLDALADLAWAAVTAGS